ncbi:hypothetical protein V8E36_000763 [Tilletia maclaganii]
MSAADDSVITLYDILPDSDNPGKRPYAVLPNPWITRLILKQKNIPFIVKPITVHELRSSEPGSFRDRFGPNLEPRARPLIPIIEHKGKIIGDNATVADYLDKTFQHSPSAYLPELSSEEATSEANQLARSLAWHSARQLRNTIGSGHAELIYEQATARFDPKQREWMRSDEKIGFPGAYATMTSKNRADLLAQTRAHLAGIFSVLNPIPLARIEGLDSKDAAQVENTISRPLESRRLFLSSPTKPGFADFTVFGWYLFTWISDRALNQAIWDESSQKARDWLDNGFKDGSDALKGDARKPGYWPGDVPLKGVPEWADRMLSLYDNYTRRIVDGEILEGEPKDL